jgi:hypothetical protein
MTDKDELAALRQRVEELERKANPPAPPKFEGGPRGLTTTELAMSRASLSREAMEKMDIPGVRDIFRDARAVQNLAPLATDVRPRLAQGPREPTPLGPPPGIAIADRLMDVQDAKDRAQLIEREARRMTSGKK